MFGAITFLFGFVCNQAPPTHRTIGNDRMITECHQTQVIVRNQSTVIILVLRFREHETDHPGTFLVPYTNQ